MMKAALSGFVASVVFFVGGQADEAALKKEKARLKGMWKITRFENAKGEDDKFKDAILVFDEAGAAELRHNGEVKKAAYKINPAAKLKELDLTAEGKDTTMKGIYELKKDMLKICLDDDPNAERPTEFAIKPGSRQALIMFERAK
jgi:uncharacterized protein (TIGR03067 family)